jgi:S1-C subfamily serine protease
MKRTLLFILAAVLGTGIATAQLVDAFPTGYGAEGFAAVLVRSVLPGGHAQECGLIEWDVITEIDGFAVDAFGGPDALGSWIREMPPRTVTVTYLRPSVHAREFTSGSATCTMPRLDLHVMAIFVAGNIPPGSDAEALGVQPGDYINNSRSYPSVGVWRRNDRWGEPGEDYISPIGLRFP